MFGGFDQQKVCSLELPECFLEFPFDLAEMNPCPSPIISFFFLFVRGIVVSKFEKKAEWHGLMAQTCLPTGRQRSAASTAGFKEIEGWQCKRILQALETIQQKITRETESLSGLVPLQERSGALHKTLVGM